MPPEPPPRLRAQGRRIWGRLFLNCSIVLNVFNYSLMFFLLCSITFLLVFIVVLLICNAFYCYLGVAGDGWRRLAAAIDSHRRPQTATDGWRPSQTARGGPGHPSPSQPEPMQATPARASPGHHSCL